MNKALKLLLRTRAIFNSCWRKLAWNANITRYQNEDQAAEAIKEVEVQCVAAIRSQRLQSSRQKPIMRLQSRRQKPIMPLKLMIWNNLKRKVCLSWSVKC